MKRFIGLMLSLVMITGTLAGCGEKPVENSSTSIPESTPAIREPVTSSADTSSDTDDAAWPRTYVDASGTEVTLEAKPKKIALLFFHHYEATLALNAPLYAAVDTTDVYNGWESLKPFSEKSELVDLGATRAPNLEKILEIEPDLIIAAAGVHDDVLDNLRKIAPTVVVSRAGNFSTWQGTLREYGKILGEEVLAEERIVNLETLIADAHDTLSAYSDKTVALARTQEKDVGYWLPDFLFSADNVGLNSSLEQQGGVGAGSIISYESFADDNPDYIFLYQDALDEVDETIWKRLDEDAVWNSMSAVKNGNVYILDRSVFSGGPLAMELGIRAITEAMTSEK